MCHQCCNGWMPMLLSVFLSSLQCVLKMYQKWCDWLVVVFPMVQLHLYPDQNRCPLLSKIWCISIQKSGASLFKNLVHPLNNLMYPFKNLIIFLFQKKSSTIRTPRQFLKNLLKILPSIPAPTLQPYGSFNMWTVQIFHMCVGHLPSLHGDIFLPFFYRILSKSLYLAVIFSLDGSKSHVKIKNKIEIRNVSYNQNEI